MALKKNKKGQMEATDQFGKLGQDYATPSYQIGNTKVSKEAYDVGKGLLGFESGKGGMITPETTNIPQVKAAMEARAAQDVGQVQPVEPNNAQPTDQTAQNTQQTADTTKPVKSGGSSGVVVPTTEQLQTAAMAANPTDAAQETANIIAANSVGTGVADINTRDVFTQNLGIALKGAFQEGLQGYDNLKVIITGGDTGNVKDARATLSRSNSLFEASMAGVATGDVPETEAMTFLAQAFSANAAMEAELKKKGINHLRYWLGSGKDLEIEIAQNKIILNRLRDQLAEAIVAKSQRAMQQQQARKRQGLQ